MNKGWGGEQPKMWDGYYLDNAGNKVIQAMLFGDDEELPKKMWGKPKGIQVVLEERGL